MKKTSIKMRKLTLCAIGTFSLIQFGFGLFMIMGTSPYDHHTQTSAASSSRINELENRPIPKLASLILKDS